MNENSHLFFIVSLDFSQTDMLLKLVGSFLVLVRLRLCMLESLSTFFKKGGKKHSLIDSLNMWVKY